MLITDTPNITNTHPIPPEFVALDSDLRFIKVKPRSKQPAEFEWPSTNNYSANDPRLIQWIQSGNNWGYFLRDDTNICVLDADNPNALEDLIKFIGSSLTVQSGREGKGYHILFRCPNLGSKKIYLKNETGSDIGDVRPGGTIKKYQSVGPGSFHPDTGRPYHIVDNSTPAIIDPDALREVLKKYQKPIQKKHGRRNVQTGEIDNYLTQQAGILFNQGFRDNGLFNALATINREDCMPPAQDSDLRRICSSAMRNFKPAAPVVSGVGGFQKPVLSISDLSLEDLTNRSLEALANRNRLNPNLFVRSGELVRILTDEIGHISISDVCEKVIRLELCRSVEYLKLSLKGPVKTDPPLNVVQNISAYGSWAGIPALNSLLRTPIIHHDSHIHMTPGYDWSTGNYYIPDTGFSVGNVPEAPTHEDIANAVTILVEGFSEFPYQDDASLCSVIGAVFSVACRNLIKGPVPMLIISKPALGTGASLLCDCVSLITTGRLMNKFVQPTEDPEWPKAIMSKLADAPPLTVIDNAEGRLSSPHLASLLTGEEYSGRLLGHNVYRTLPAKTVWIANGNNLRIGTDLPRRCYWCRLDAKACRPWEIEGFTHPNLVEWISKNRGEIVKAILTITRGWILAGSPGWKRSEGQKIMGGFESWCQTIGGIIDFAGIPGFLTNQDDLYTSVDTDTPMWDSFFSSWYDIFQSRAITVKELTDYMMGEIHDSNVDETIYASLPEPLLGVAIGSQQFKVKLGSELSRNADRLFPSGVILKKGQSVKRALRWVVEKSESDEGSKAGYIRGESVKQRLTHVKNGFSLSDFETDNNPQLSQGENPPVVSLGESISQSRVCKKKFVHTMAWKMTHQDS